MTHTLKDNYARNLEILRENIKRGMTLENAKNVINMQERQFIQAGLYNQAERDYIDAMRAEAITGLTHITINIIK